MKLERNIALQIGNLRYTGISKGESKMLVYGYAKDSKYADDGQLLIQVRIPNIHGPNTQQEFRGQRVSNYVLDKDLPWYPALILPHIPNVDEVVALTNINESSTDFVVVGITGGEYNSSLIES